MSLAKFPLLLNNGSNWPGNFYTHWMVHFTPNPKCHSVLLYDHKNCLVSYHHIEVTKKNLLKSIMYLFSCLFESYILEKFRIHQKISRLNQNWYFSTECNIRHMPTRNQKFHVGWRHINVCKNWKFCWNEKKIEAI